MLRSKMNIRAGWVLCRSVLAVCLLTGPAAGQSEPKLDYRSMAGRIVESLQIQHGERVVVRFDSGYFQPLRHAVRERALEAGANEVLELQYAPVGAAQVSLAGAKIGRPRAPGFEKLLRDTDIYIWLPERVGVVGTPPVERALLGEWLDMGGERRQIHFHWARGSVRADGLAGEHTPELDELYQEALDVDYQRISDAQDRVIYWLRLATVRVRTPAGTDLRFRVGRRPFNKQDGNASASRVRKAQIRIDREIELPCGVLRVAPLEETVEGTLVVPEGRFGMATARGVRFEIRRGQVVDVSAEENLAAVRDYLKQNGSAARKFREFGLGFNPKLKPPPGSDILPYFGYGEGVVRLSLGDNSELGGMVTGGFTRWFFFPDATVEVPGRAVVENGKLAEEFR